MRPRVVKTAAPDLDPRTEQQLRDEGFLDADEASVGFACSEPQMVRDLEAWHPQHPKLIVRCKSRGRVGWRWMVHPDLFDRWTTHGLPRAA